MEATFKILQDNVSFDLFNEKLTLWFFGDIHRDTNNCDVDRWKWFLKKAEEQMTPNTYFIGMGDYHDFASTKEKRFLNSDGVHEATRDRFDEMAERNNRELASEMSFMRGHILGLIEGNHSWKFQTGKTSTDDLAERLGTKEMGWLCHYTLTCKNKGNHHSANSVHMVLCHGKAGGKTAGITVNQVADLKPIFPVADIYCMGHDHQRIAHPSSCLVPQKAKGGYKIKQKRQLLCRSGTFAKTYQDNSHSYEIFRLYKPSDIGALKITIGFHRDHKDNDERIILDLEAVI